MTKRLICDTNIFYYLSTGALELKDIVRSTDEVIFFSPVSILELTGKLTELTFSERKAVASAILSSKAQALPDPESYLTTLFGLSVSSPAVDWGQAAKAISLSSSFDQLRKAVPDYQDKVVRRVNTTIASQWRETMDKNWMQDIHQVMNDQIAGFQSWYHDDPTKRKGKKPHLRSQKKIEFLNSTKSKEWFITLNAACQQKAFYSAQRPEHFVPTPQHAQVLMAAIEAVRCYCRVYTQYLIALLTTEMLPQPNDKVDLELFTYCATNDDIVVTAEKRWVNLAKDACYGNRVRKMKPRPFVKVAGHT